MTLPRPPGLELLDIWYQESGVDWPWVTLSYAQSLDGSLTQRRGQPTALSGPETLQLTHQLRAWHQALLVGIDTVLADDPQLTVRLVEGPQPQPVVLDSRLRFPLQARLWEHPRGIWLVTTPQGAAQPQRRVLEERGARVWVVSSDPQGRVSLPDMLAVLAGQGIATVMVEGGARVITAFLQQRLAHALVVTVVPRVLAGLRVPEGKLPHEVRLQESYWQPLGRDVVLWARLR